MRLLMATATLVSRLVGLCVSREFYLFAAGKSSPIVEWLKNLARLAHRECGERGIGVVGMCLTGNFALAMVPCSAPSPPAGLPRATQQPRLMAARFQKSGSLAILAGDPPRLTPTGNDRRQNACWKVERRSG
jgi:hypothetical protein